MKKRLWVALTLLIAAAALAQTNVPDAPPRPGQAAPHTPAAAAPAAPQQFTVSAVFERQLSGVEREFVGAAEAMPEEKYGFAPTNGEFKGVRTFAEQVRHVAFTNMQVFSAMLGQPVPAETPNDNGPAELKSKADILKYLRDSFALGHRALALVSEQNLVIPMKSPFGEGRMTRLGGALLIQGHTFDHYGQLVEYLRMNGIIPPASRR